MAESRTDRRSNVFLTATLVMASGSVAVRVRNISARGALIDGAALPPEGTAIELRRGSLAAAGDIDDVDLRGVIAFPFRRECNAPAVG